MNTGLAVLSAPEWVGALQGFGADLGTPTAVIGDQAAAVASAMRRTGAAAPVIVAVTPEPLRDVEPGGLGLVVLRRVWKAPAGVDAVVAAARRALRPGGRLVAADFDVDRVMGAPLRRYPSQLFYAAHPEVAAGLRKSSASVLDLAVALVRAEFGRVESTEVDETLGFFDEADSLRHAVETVGWRGFADAAPAAVDAVLSRLTEMAPALLRGGGVPLREPWVVVTGVKR